MRRHRKVAGAAAVTPSTRHTSPFQVATMAPLPSGVKSNPPGRIQLCHGLSAGRFDFTPDGKGAIVATWNGDVWRVDGVTAAAPATLRWRRIASGFFQPLGVKF